MVTVGCHAELRRDCTIGLLLGIGYIECKLPAMLKKLSLAFCCLCYVLSASAQKEVNVIATPADADLYKIINGSAVKIGSGSVILKLEKEIPITIEARKEGYVPVQKMYLRKKDGSASDNLELTDRIIQLNVTPADATIYINSIEKARSSHVAIIPKGQSITVDVKKPGFVPQSRIYYNKEGQESPELSHLFKLEDKVITIRTLPMDAEIYVDDKKKGEGSAEVIIPRDKCVNIRIEKPGFIAKETRYCNKENENVPLLTEELRLKDRKIQFNVSPDDAKIFVDGKEVGKGSSSVKVMEDRCVEVMIVRASYVTEKYDLCNKAEYQQPEPIYAVKMSEDEAYQQSEESSVANKNFTVEVNPATAPVEAWKRLTSIIQSRFDEIETIDGTTSYLRTSWVGSTFNKNSLFKSIVRTRVIITSAGTAPLKYNVKIQSEISKADCIGSKSSDGKPLLTTSMDQCFEPVDRLLRKYTDLIREVQVRLQ
jgi:hypothetical protein